MAQVMTLGSEPAIGRLGLKTRVVELTPLLAQEWFAGQVKHNRKLSKAHVDNLARQIIGGYWKLNGEAIKFDRSGKMCDGQHRCAAVIKAQRSILVLVVEDLPEEAFITFDGRGARRVSDFLTVPNAKTHAAILGMLHRYVQGTFPGKAGRLAPTEAMELERAYPMVGQAATWARVVADVCPGAPIGFICLYYGFLSPQSSPELADKFARLLADGSGMAADHPIFRLRERCLSIAKRGTRIEERYLLALAVKAFKAFREGRSVGVLKYIDGEEFPTLD